VPADKARADDKYFHLLKIGHGQRRQPAAPLQRCELLQPSSRGSAHSQIHLSYPEGGELGAPAYGNAACAINVKGQMFVSPAL
jgi:hypothetical protein